MEPMTGLDASFLYLETQNAPMHIGGVAILAGDTPRGRITLETVRELLASRLHVSRSFTQRLASTAFGLGRPSWVEDRDFALDRHVQRTQLPEPGGWKELRALASWEFSQPLSRDRPLWEFLFVEGLDTVDGVPPGSVAIISKIHHAAIDGVSGSEIMSALFDPTPEPRALEAPAPASQPPSRRLGGLARAAGKSILSGPPSLGGVLGDVVKGVVKSGVTWGIERVKPPPFPFSAPRTRWNAPVSRRRAWCPAFLDLGRIQQIRRATGGTVNDVVLAICAHALRGYLETRNELPDEPLVAMVPISVREKDERGTMGNRVSAMLVSLATDVADPAERLRQIRAGADSSKLYHRAIGARNLSDYSEFIPFGLAGVGARLYTRMQLAERHKPIFNLVITNVPGPQIPLYIGGARLLAHAGTAPIFDGMGLILPIFSYDGTLAVGVTSCPEIMPDVEDFSRLLARGLDELEAATAAEDPPASEPAAAER